MSILHAVFPSGFFSSGPVQAAAVVGGRRRSGMRTCRRIHGDQRPVLRRPRFRRHHGHWRLRRRRSRREPAGGVRGHGLGRRRRHGTARYRPASRPGPRHRDRPGRRPRVVRLVPVLEHHQPDHDRGRRDRALWFDLRRQHRLAAAGDRLRRSGPVARRCGVPASAAELYKPGAGCRPGHPGSVSSG